MESTKSRRKEKRLPSKMCVRCGKIQPLNEFYNNRGWATQSFHDAWCKTCVVSFCKDIETLREYCWYNNRRWSDEFWDASMKKARYSLANNKDFLSAREGSDKRLEVEGRTACRQFFSMMHLGNVYHYSANIGEEGAYKEYDGESSAGTMIRDESGALHDDGELIYNREWNGMYTQREIDYLNDYYEKLEEGFVLDNQNIQDYARKAAKASLDADIKYNKMRQGLGLANDWKEAQAIFDNLSKSANFAACRRKPGDSAGLGALGLIVQRIEATGKISTPLVAFPKDDIDRIIEDFEHTVRAIGMDDAGA